MKNLQEQQRPYIVSAQANGLTGHVVVKASGFGDAKARALPQFVSNLKASTKEVEASMTILRSYGCHEDPKLDTHGQAICQV